jgi:cyclohexanone monooxygenase
VASSSTADPTADVDVVVVGGGMAGLYTTYRLRQLGKSVRTFERGDGVGGTWYWNRYPGARVDGESLSYSFSFSEELQQEWHWTEKYASQAELKAYLNHVADRFDLRKDIQLSTAVTSASYDEKASQWVVSTDKGDVVRARYLVSAVGCLSASNVPEFPGLSDFRGEWYHTSQWPEGGVDLSGKRVGVVGTGSTGIQVIPELAKVASHLYVFQRTPSFTIPSNNVPMDPDRESDWKARYAELRAEARRTPTGSPLGRVPDKSAMEVSEDERIAEFERQWLNGHFNLMRSFNDLTTNEDSNESLADFVRSKIQGIVKDQKTAVLLSPRGFPIGTKRVCMDSGFYETFNRENVSLVDVRSAPIQGFSETALKTADNEYELDVVVFATGFDAMTGGLTRLGVIGRGGVELAKKWEGGPTTYLGLATVGFPNCFFVTGPGSPSVLSNVCTSIEQHVEWITDLIAHADEQGATTVEATAEAEDGWGEHCREIGAKTLFTKANSWYMGANIPGKPRMLLPYVGGVGKYGEICDEVRSDGYRGFAIASPDADPVLTHA